MASGTNQYFRRDRIEPKQAENQITFGKKLMFVRALIKYQF